MTSKYRDFAVFVLVSAVFGASFVAINVGVAVVPPVFFAALRFDVTAVLLFGYVVYTVGHWRPRSRREWVAVVVGGGLMVGLNNALLYAGQQYTTSAVASVVHSMIPVLTVVVAHGLLPEERLGLPGLVGVALGLTGVVVIARPDPSALFAGSGRGVALIFGAAASAAVGSVLVRRLRPALPTAALTAWAMLLGAVAMHGMSLVAAEPVRGIEWTPPLILALLYLAVPAGAIAHAGYFHLLEQIGPTQSNLMSYAAPIFAALTGWLVLRESLSVPTVAGFLLIFAGFLLIKRRALAEELPRLQARLSR